MTLRTPSRVSFPAVSAALAFTLAFAGGVSASAGTLKGSVKLPESSRSSRLYQGYWRLENGNVPVQTAAAPRPRPWSSSRTSTARTPRPPRTVTVEIGGLDAHPRLVILGPGSVVEIKNTGKVTHELSTPDDAVGDAARATAAGRHPPREVRQRRRLPRPRRRVPAHHDLGDRRRLALLLDAGREGALLDRQRPRRQGQAEGVDARRVGRRAGDRGADEGRADRSRSRRPGQEEGKRRRSKERPDPHVPVEDLVHPDRARRGRGRGRSRSSRRAPRSRSWRCSRDSGSIARSTPPSRCSRSTPTSGSTACRSWAATPSSPTRSTRPRAASGEYGVVHKTLQDRFRALIPDLATGGIDEIVALDHKGRVIARVGGDNDKEYGDYIGGAEVIADALRGYMSDDVWGKDGKLMRVAGAPVLSKSHDRIVGALYVGAETGRQPRRAPQEEPGRRRRAAPARQGDRARRAAPAG